MKLTSRDRTMRLAIAAPGTGFALTLDDHVWLFDKDGRITGSVPPRITADEIAEGAPRHQVADSPEQCPICAAFVERNYTHGSAEGEQL